MRQCSGVDVGFTARPLFSLATHACKALSSDPQVKSAWEQGRAKREALARQANARSTAVLKSAAQHGPKALALFWLLETASLQRSLVNLGMRISSLAANDSPFTTELLALPGNPKAKASAATELTMASPLFQALQQNVNQLMNRLFGFVDTTLLADGLRAIYSNYLGAMGSADEPSDQEMKSRLIEFGKAHAEDAWAQFGEQAMQRFGAYSLLLELLQNQKESKPVDRPALPNLETNDLELYREAVRSTISQALAPYQSSTDAWRSLSQDLQLAQRLALWVNSAKGTRAAENLIEDQLQSIASKRRSLHADSRAIAAQHMARRHAKLHQHLIQVAPPMH
jgi:hypothetical protein